jgi:DNA-binding transcriptional LysR family regulator
MKLAGVDLNLLLVLDAMLEERNTTRAGQRIGLSQPAVSHALNRLRHLFKDELFVRTPEGMIPTARALEIATPLREGLLKIESTVEEGGFVAAETTREFVIAASDQATMGWIAPLGCRMRNEAPRAMLRVVPVATIDVAKELEFGTLDLAVGRFTAVPDRFRSQCLGEDRAVWVMRSDHPLARKRVLTIEDLANAAHLRVSLANVAPDGTGEIDQHGLRRQVALDEDAMLDRVLAEQGSGVRRTVVSVPYFAVVPLFLAATDLIAVLPRRAAAALEGMARLALRDPPYETPVIRILAVWHIHQDAQPAHRWLRRLIGEACRGGPADAPTDRSPIRRANSTL